MKNLHYILAVLIFFAMAVSVSHGAFIFIAMALYIAQLILGRKEKKNEKEASVGGGGSNNDTGIDGPIRDLPGKETHN
jgi:hypothetical protein